MGTVAHHRNRSRHFLSRSASQTDAGQTRFAAESLRRAASHAVTAAAVHWHFRYHSKRRLNTVIYNLVIEGRIPYSCVLNFREIYGLPSLIDNASDHLSTRILRRHYRRALRLINTLDTAMTRQPNPPTLEQVIAAALAGNDNEPSQAKPVNPAVPNIFSPLDPAQMNRPGIEG